MSPLRRAAAGLGLVTFGFVLSPTPVPVYDGIGAPDEPYRYVNRPAGAPVTAEPTSARSSSPVEAGVTSYGMNTTTAEQGPQFTVFVPPKALRVVGGTSTLQVVVTPLATATDRPAGKAADGNTYQVALASGSGTVTLTAQSALSTLQMRATTAKQPGPVVHYRPGSSGAWRPLQTTRSGNEIYAARFPGAGQFQLAFTADAPTKGSSPVKYYLLGGVLLVVVVVVAVRLRTAT